MEVLDQNCFQTNTNQRQAMIDIIRLLLAFIILSSHVWDPYSSFLHDGNNLAPGYLAVEAFFMISGYYLVSSAKNKQNINCWQYTWRRIWDYLPLLTMTIIGTLLIFSITSTIYLKPMHSTALCWWTWFIWTLFFVGTILYAIWQKFGAKFTPIAMLIGIGCYVSLYFINPCIHHPIVQGSIFETIGVTLGCDLLRGFGGMLLGGTLFYITTTFKKIPDKKIVRAIITILGLLSSFIALFYMLEYPKTQYDFLVASMMFIMLFCVFTGYGFLTKLFILNSNTSKSISRFSYVLYIQQWLVIHFIGVFAEENAWLWTCHWWLILYGLLTYICSIVLTLLFMRWDKKIKKNIMCKFKKLNNI